MNKDIEVWPDAQGRVSWIGRFFDYLKARGRISDLSFVSFEHYPFEPCVLQWSSLYDEANLVRHVLDVWREDGLPKGVPMFITETNIAAGSDESFVDTFAALWWADFVGAFLEAGGNAAYYFHYIPLGESLGCHATSPGTFGFFTMSRDYEIQQPTSQFFASQMINLEWVQPGSDEHRIFPSATDIRDDAGHVLVTSYALLRPDGQWSLMLVNKDQQSPHALRIAFHRDDRQTDTHFAGPVEFVTFGSEQYQWHTDLKLVSIGGSADPDGPPARSTLSARPNTIYVLPKASVTVIRGKLDQ